MEANWPLPERSPNPRKQGGQPGHEGTTRKLVAEDRLAQVIDHWPASCSGCGADLDSGERVGVPDRHQGTELPPTAVTVTVTEYRAHACAAPAAASKPGQRCRRKLGSAPSALAFRQRSRSCRSATGSPAATPQSSAESCLAQGSQPAASSAFASPYPELREAVNDAPVPFVDETARRNPGQKRTLWGALTDTHAAFHIAADRHERELPELIGEGFAGIVSSDRRWAYDSLVPARPQLCWAHLLRNFRRHSDGLAEQGRFGEAGLEICRELFAAWDAFAAHGDHQRLAREIAPFKRRLRALLEPHQIKSARNRQFRTFARNRLKLWPALLTFTEVEGVEPTNNRAERGLRSAVIYAKIFSAASRRPESASPSGRSQSHKAASCRGDRYSAS